MNNNINSLSAIATRFIDTDKRQQFDQSGDCIPVILELLSVSDVLSIAKKLHTSALHPIATHPERKIYHSWPQVTGSATQAVNTSTLLNIAHVPRIEGNGSLDTGSLKTVTAIDLSATYTVAHRPIA